MDANARRADVECTLDHVLVAECSVQQVIVYAFAVLAKVVRALVTVISTHQSFVDWLIDAIAGRRFASTGCTLRRGGTRNVVGDANPANALVDRAEVAIKLAVVHVIVGEHSTKLHVTSVIGAWVVIFASERHTRLTSQHRVAGF